MAYLALLWKARTIEKYRLRYEKEKINSINSKAELSSTLYQKWTVYRNDSQRKFEQIYRNFCPEGSRLAYSCAFVKEHSSFLFRIMIGIAGGIMTYFLYTIFVIQPSIWTCLGWVIVVAIILGVVFSDTARCLVLLLIPGLFSRVGRYTLACYALVLILTGPATNTLKNLDTLSASLACGQEQIKASVKEIKESKDSPLNLMKETIGGTIEKIEYLAGKMKNLMTRINRLTMSIAHVFQSSLSWLNSIETTCNTKLGTPYEHCTNILVKGKKNCQKEFPESANQWNWNLLVQAACYNLKPAEPLCIVGDFAKGSIVATVKKKLNTYSTRVQSLLATAVHIHRSHACCNGSLPVSQAAAGVITDLRNRADTLLAWLSWTCALTGLFLMLIILRAKYYLHMFRTRSRFDNRYVTHELRELDLKRQRQGRETVLPLNTRERAKYVSTSSTRLLPTERMYLTRSIVFMVITTLKLMIHMVADYSLYWVLTNVRVSTKQIDFQPSNRTERMLVSGSGPLAATVRTLVEALSVPLVLPAASTAACLPDPNPPDLQRYAHIGMLIVLLWLLALFEPYGLRLRHVISGHYQPERAKARAVWLYYHIIRTRSCFLKYARRKLHRQFKYKSEEKFTFKNWLNNFIPCHWLRKLLRTGPAEPHCLLCCTKHRQEDLDRHLKRCETPSCPGVYCTRCFYDIGQLCTICYSPEDYGDLSDVSMEKFTTDESDNCDDDAGDNIPLMGRPDYDIEDEYEKHNNRAKKNYSSQLLISKFRNGNQEESTPLIDCGYLNKDYTQQKMTIIKHVNTVSLHKDFLTKDKAQIKSRRFDFKDETTMHKLDQNNEDKVIKISPIKKGKKAPLVFRNTDVTVNGITFPKEKLNAIRKIMMLLTAKDENSDKYKSNSNKHKSFEYLVMEMFQPFDIFQRRSPLRYNKSTNKRHLDKTKEKNEPTERETQFLFDNKVFAKAANSNEAMPNSNLQTDFLFKNPEPILKHNQINQDGKKEASTTINKKMWSARRKVIEGSKHFTIKCDKHKVTWKKRKRRDESDTCGSLITYILRKLFRKKTIDHVINYSLHDAHSKSVKGNIARGKIRKSKKQKMVLSSFISTHTCSLQNNVHNLSTVAKDGTLYIKSDGESTNESASEDSIEVIGNRTRNDDGDLNTSVKQRKKQNNMKLGFWQSLRLRRKHTRPPYLFSISLTNEPTASKFFPNHKRRKKSQLNQKDIANREVRNEIETRYCKESRNLTEEELYKRMAKYNGILNMRHNENLEGISTKIAGPFISDEQQKTKGIVNSSNEANHNKLNQTAKPAEEFQQSETREEAAHRAGEFNILSDHKKNTAEKNETLINFTKKFKTISQVAFTFNKKKKSPRSVVFSGGVMLKVSDVDINEQLGFACVSSEDLTDSKDDQPQHDNINYVDKEVESSTYIQMKAKKPCFHEWIVKPKKLNEYQKSGSYIGSGRTNLHRYYESKKERNRNDISTFTSMTSLKSKRNQSKSTDNSNVLHKQVNENQTVELQDAFVQTQGACHCTSKQQNTKIGKSYGLIDLPTARPFKGRIIKEVTKIPIASSESDTEEASLEHSEEGTIQTKNTANRSMTTVAQKVAHVSTLTSDWWSPILHRKPMRNKQEFNIEKSFYRNNHIVPTIIWDTSLYRDVSAEMMSASNYLLQSEPYCNQILAINPVSTSRGSRSCVKKYYVREKPSFKMYRPLPNKGSKAKRLKGCYSSHKKQLHGSSIILPPTPVKWQPVITDQQAHALKYYKRRNIKSKKRNRISEKGKQEKDGYENSQTNSNMWSASIFSGSY